ncbi:MAG: Holliday junction resolvase RuvX [Candidatus Aminicenantes bacterium]|nr:Holliday junction resolvase RuvX [Candidatus Aminicenantes bacterium]
MRILGVDYGDRHIGLALSDPLGMIAQPLETYTLKEKKADNAAFFRELVQKHGVERIVLGLPLRMDGTPGSRAEKTRAFARWLEASVGRKVVFWDERLTTRQATTIMQEQSVRVEDRRSVVNQISAALILQAYLDGQATDAPDTRSH